jgi:hypothetical protein
VFDLRGVGGAHSGRLAILRQSKDNLPDIRKPVREGRGMPQSVQTIDEVSLPLAPRLLNLWGNTLARAGLTPAPFKAADLRQAAEAATGLEDRGAAARFDPLLDHLLESAASEARLTPFGRAFLRQDCVSVLSHQLLAQQLFRRHPEVLELPVARPLFIVGFFRSGTTLLQRILGGSPHARSLRTWEALRPVSERFSSRGGTEDGRIQATQRDIRTLRRFVLPKVHLLEAHAPEESLFLLRHMFSSLVQWALFGGDTYLRRLLGQDTRPVYESLRSLLQALQWQTPGGRWILKTGQHLLDLDVIAEVFPDAGFVWTHRDPTELVPSFLSTAACFRQGTNARPVDLPHLARNCLEIVDAALARAMESKVVKQGDRVLHVPYPGLVTDPIGTATRVCERFDLPVDDDTSRRMHTWSTANPQERWGRHWYDLGPFGVDAGDVSRRYAEYSSRFIATGDESGRPG